MSMLAIVMPVFNEQASIRRVVTEWFEEVEIWTQDFVLLAINDGSTDATPMLLEHLREKFGSRLQIHTQKNRGHGQACLEGCRLALSKGAQWIFQIDSDGQCDPQFFFVFWRERERFDVIYGKRARREDGWRRRLASQILRVVVLAVSGAWCADPNVPYRLMRAEILRGVVDQIPADFYLANVALAVLLKRKGKLRHGTIPIGFRHRYGGEPTISFWDFGSRAWQLVEQLRGLPKDR